MKRRQVVIDASAALPAVFPEEHSERARALCDEAEQLVVPELWAVECGNAAWKRVRRGLSTASEAMDALALIEGIPATRIDTEPLAAAALTIALSCRITMYDALYVATTQYVDGTLVTADERLLTALRAAQWQVRAIHLSEWQAG